jgi:signal transduction histidine kinase
VTAGIGTIGGVSVIGWLWMAVRQRGVRRRDADTLREQIARDLHDDIGSNLAGIVLLSEAGAANAEAKPDIQNDFREIKETAEQTSESMRDIVWLIHVKKTSLRDMLIKMRESVELILGDLSTSIRTEPSDFRNRPLTLLQRRHLFFAFKESLHNVRKHALATHVSISFEIASKTLTFVVADDGIGFDLDRVGESGHGLENLKRRASRVQGRCLIVSSPGGGTSITFSMPLNKRNR